MDIEELDVEEFVVVPDDEADANIVGALMEEFEVPFNANLAEFLDEDEMSKLAIDLLDNYEIDKRSRSEWEDTYREGLDLLGLKIEDRDCPWKGAFGAHHPLLTEAVVKFQSETIVETFPSQGPVKVKILGEIDRDREAAGKRVREDMNHWLTDEMPEYRSEHERLLWSLPIAGSAFKKIWRDPYGEKPVTQFVPADDFIVSYGATDLRSAERYTHRMKKSPNEVRKLQLSEFYRDVFLGEPTPDLDDLEEKRNEFSGLDGSEDARHELLEMHCNMDLVGFEDVDKEGLGTGLELPYIVTIERSSRKILAIYRNWIEGDIKREKRIHFSHYTYIPGFGFYGFGLIHLIGGFTKGATSIMRQLVDAGTLSNLPGGFKTRGFRIVGGDHPVAPGEWRDADTPTGTLKDNLMPLPYKEPSIVLFELLKGIVDEGRRFAAVADVNISDMQPNAPVGSTLAVLERTLKTMTAVHARIHAAMRHEFTLIKDIILSLGDYNYDAVGDQRSRQEDYSVVEVIPVSDPNASTMSQRIVQYQAALQLMQMNPGIYDQPLLHRSMLETLQIKDASKLVPDKSDIAPADPVTENMNILNGAPVKAEQHQDHKAHLTVHMSLIQDPQMQAMMQQQGASGQQKASAGMAHVNEHLAFEYRKKIEEQIGQLPSPEKPLPPELEVQLSGAMAQASQALLQQSQQEFAQQQSMEEQQDPLNIIQRAELDLQAGELERKKRKDDDDFKLKSASIHADMASDEKATELERAKMQEKVDESLRKENLERDKAVADNLMKDMISERGSNK